MKGTINKLRSTLGEQVDYYLPIGDESVHLNPFIGQSIQFQFTGNIYCDACGTKTKKSYSQGHCFKCMKTLARCDMCIMKPETCHYDKGTCREPDWADTFCMTAHYVYLSNTSGVKVGITRENQIPTRWIDQGATQALPIMKVKSRFLSGLIEVELAKSIADKTNWRAMLKGESVERDLQTIAKTLIESIDVELDNLRAQFGEDAIDILSDDMVDIHYPVTQYPTKITSHNLDKNPVVGGVLQGIKGQYLLLDTGVINMRKFTSYEIEWQS
ncbi:DUF2797 domain-containing protein [Thaumasiovibrio subtropicus]|uniref:DUF2797 domain-containing protein n=1 Tax=Thaumasiovibrio subtropicus TaxID=1891207 RepID=UPI000B353790|nr:DUF2797 domain-containing protein [Thaumasiovibrio subtropicus]